MASFLHNGWNLSRFFAMLFLSIPSLVFGSSFVHVACLPILVVQEALGFWLWYSASLLPGSDGNASRSVSG
jgi:hypothetical protein